MAEELPPEEPSEEKEPSGLNVPHLERVLTYAVAGLCIIGWFVLQAMSPNGQVSKTGILALIGTYGLTKVVVMVLAIREGWRGWQGLLAEIAAIAVLGQMIWSGIQGGPHIVLIVAFLLLGMYLRRRAMMRDNEESE